VTPRRPRGVVLGQEAFSDGLAGGGGLRDPQAGRENDGDGRPPAEGKCGDCGSRRGLSLPRAKAMRTRGGGQRTAHARSSRARGSEPPQRPAIPAGRADPHPLSPGRSFPRVSPFVPHPLPPRPAWHWRTIIVPDSTPCFPGGARRGLCPAIDARRGHERASSGQRRGGSPA
jgi:hypothetical protein